MRKLIPSRVIYQLRNWSTVVGHERSRMNFKQRKEMPLKHLFDGSELNVYDTKVINLSAGTPSENLLKDCGEIFKTATEHRMVSDLHFLQSLIAVYWEVNHLNKSVKHLIRNERT